MSGAVDLEPGGAPAAGAPHRREWRMPAVPASVPALRAAVRAFAAAHDAPAALVPDLAIAVTEAVTNAVLHAYVDMEPGSVSVIAQAAPEELIVSVIDEGRGMQPRPDSTGLRLGLPTIGQLTVAVDLRDGPGGVGTEVRMRFAAPGVSGPLAAISDRDERYHLLADVSAIVQGGGWPTQALERLVDLLVPSVADVCAVDVVDAGGVPRPVAARVDGDGGEELARWLLGRPPPDVDGPSPAYAALRTAGSILVEITPEFLHALAHDGEDAAGLARTGLAWWLAVPLLEGERVLGLLHFGLRADRPRPDGERAAFLEALGERAAYGLANTQLVEALRRTQGRLERILGTLAEAVTVHDQEGRTVYANEAAARLLDVGSVAEVLAAAPGELAARFVITREDGTPVGVDDLPGRRIVEGRDAPPLLTRSVNIASGRARWLLTKATLLDDDGTFAVNVIEDVTEAKESERRQRFLAQAGEVLGMRLDPERALQGLAELVAGALADWCVVDLVTTSGGLERVAVAHADPAKLVVAREMERRYPPNDPPSEALRALLAGGEGRLYALLTDEMLAARAVDEEHLRMLREVGMRSVMLAPMRVADRTLGVITMISAESVRTFGADDLGFAQEVARRAAAALENARPGAERP